MSKYWEIMELPDGSFVLQSSEDEDQPLLRIEFSGEAKGLLQDNLPEVASVMIGAGIQTAGLMTDVSDDHDVIPNKLTLH